jgi:hypothetical protein
MLALKDMGPSSYKITRAKNKNFYRLFVPWRLSCIYNVVCLVPKVVKRIGNRENRIVNGRLRKIAKTIVDDAE